MKVMAPTEADYQRTIAIKDQLSRELGLTKNPHIGAVGICSDEERFYLCIDIHERAPAGLEATFPQRYEGVPVKYRREPEARQLSRSTTRR